MGLNPMLQQRSVAQVVVSLAEDVRVFLKQLSKLLLLERGRDSLVMEAGKEEKKDA